MEGKMKVAKFFLIACFFIEVNAQTRPANLEIPITVSDNSNPPYSSITLYIGLDSIATDGIDPFLGEVELPCYEHFFIETDCPPVDHFGAVMVLPPFTGILISYKDFRNGHLPYTGQKQHQLAYQAHSTATEVVIQWNFPQGAAGVLQDLFGIINVQMEGTGSYTIPQQYINVLTRFWIYMSYTNVIPVELTSFTSEFLQDEIAVKLCWTTATEANNSGFEIQRQVGSRQSPVGNWMSIGFVPGFGTSTETKTYSFIDENLISGTYKYRLKQIDFDGSFEYSNEIEVEVDFTPIEFVLYQNYPNPFNPSTSIKFEIPSVIASGAKQSQFVTLKVYDILGNEVATLVNEEKQPGVYEVEFNTLVSHSGEVRNLSAGRQGPASGVYFYQLKAGSFIQTMKMILMK
jgi:hypothetical protein